jgi:hypothetical protein
MARDPRVNCGRELERAALVEEGSWPGAVRAATGFCGARGNCACVPRSPDEGKHFF